MARSSQNNYLVQSLLQNLQGEDEEVDEQILWPLGQMENMQHRHNDDQGNIIDKLHRTKRKVMNDDRLLWPDGIVYYLFDGSHCK